MTSFAPGTNSDYANAYNNWWFNQNGQGPAPQRSAFGPDSPVGKAQSIQPQSQGTPYGQPKKSTPFSAYSPQQQGGAFSAYQTPSSFSAGGGMGNYAYAQPNARPQPFVQQTFDFTGQQADPTQLFAQRDAFVQSINNARAPFAMAVGQGTATAPQQLDFQQLWGQAGDMAQGGFANPFAQQQYSQPKPSQADAIRSLFTQNNIQAPQGFMDQLLGMLGQQAPAQQLQPQNSYQDDIWSGPARRPNAQQVAWFESQFPQIPKYEVKPYDGTPRQPSSPTPRRDPSEDFVNTGAGWQVLSPWRNQQTGETFRAPDSGWQPRPGAGWEPSAGIDQGGQRPNGQRGPRDMSWLNRADISFVDGVPHWSARSGAQLSESGNGHLAVIPPSPMTQAQIDYMGGIDVLRQRAVGVDALPRRSPAYGEGPGTAQPIQPPRQGTPYQPGQPTRNAWDSGSPGQLPGPYDERGNLPSPPAADNKTRSYHIQIGQRRADDAQAITNQFAYRTDSRPGTKMIVDQMNQAVAAYQREPTSEREAMVNDIVRRAREAVQKDESQKNWAAKQPLISERRNEDFWADRRLRSQYGIAQGKSSAQETAAYRKAYDKMMAETTARREAYDNMNPAQKAIADRYGMGGQAHKSVAKQDGWGAGARSVAQGFQEMLLLKNYTGDRNPDTSKIPGDTLSAIRDLAAKKAAALSPKEVEAQRSLQMRLQSRDLEQRAKAEKELAKMLSGDSKKKKK